MGDNWSGQPNGKIPLSMMTKVNAANVPGSFLQPDAANAWASIKAAAARAGFTISFNEGYRDYNTQVYYRDQYLNHGGNPAGIPGTSKHGYGLAIDIDYPMTIWTSSLQIWWQQNEAKYGWSSAQGKVDGEPWHKVYIGPTTTPAGGGSTPINNSKREDEMYLIWNTSGSGYLYTPFGAIGVSKQEYNLLYRVINSDQLRTPFVDDIKGFIGNATAGQPMVYNQQEIAILNAVQTRLVAQGIPASSGGGGGSAPVDYAALAKAVNDDAAARLAKL